MSVGQLVAAAVSAHASGSSAIRLSNSIAREQEGVERIKARPAPLPPLSVANELLEAYFNGPHVVLPFIQRREIYDQLGALYSIPSFSQRDLTHRIAVFLVNMVFAVGAIDLRTKTTLSSTPVDFYITAMKEVEVLSECKPTAQAQGTLLILTFGRQNGVGVGNLWDLARQAVRICVQAGFHRAPNVPLDPLVEQTQRRIFWSAYCSDRHHSSTWGRPLAIADEDITVEPPWDLNDDDIAAGRLSQLGSSEATVLVRHIDLRKISSAAQTMLFANRESSSRLSVETEGIVRRLLNQLDSWRSTCALIVTPVNSFETIDFVDINYHRERMRISSAVITPLEAQPPNIHEAFYAWSCLESATHILDCYSRLQQSGALVVNWTYIRDVLQSGFLILFSGLQFVRIRTPEEENQRHGKINSIRQAISSCRNTLENISQQWRTVVPHRIAFVKLSDEVNKALDAEEATDARLAQSASSNTVTDFANATLDVFDPSFDLATEDIFGLSHVEMNDVFGIQIPSIDWSLSPNPLGEGFG